MHLDAQQPAELQAYLARKGWISDDEAIRQLTKPGEGNMNYTLRVETADRSLIVKQARGYVEKYPSIAAPAERAVIEGRFYQKIAQHPALSQRMPTLLGLDEAQSVLVLEDLGMASDYTALYQPECKLHADDARQLTAYLSVLHAQFATAEPDPTFANRAMRVLNHAHIFDLPFRPDNGFDLDTVQPGLQALARPYQHDDALRTAAQALGEHYLAEAPAGTSATLLHGDFYPGSWLRTTQGVRVIDPEFCFYGPAEFDLGVMLAHLYLAQQDEALIRRVRTYYAHPDDFNERLLAQFTGIELLRRLIGLAQLPLSLSVSEKAALLKQGAALVLG